MKDFEEIIGYETLKQELKRNLDILKNPEKYKTLGVTIPHGMMLEGPPGVGKTLISNCFIKASGRKAFVCRKNLPDGEFIKHIKKTFDEAVKNVPSIVLLDDIDKFENCDEKHRNAEAYVVVQSCIDEVKEKDVFVIATANDGRLLLPNSLVRSGRFDIRLSISPPSGKDAEKIVEHYLKQKKIAADVDAAEIARILNLWSCAALETIINEAGAYAGFENKQEIEREHLIKACENFAYHSDSSFRNESNSHDLEVAYHEAGHAVVSEVLNPNSVTMVSIGREDVRGIGGFTSYYVDETYWNSMDNMEKRVLCLLAGRAATEVVFGKIDIGSHNDIDRANRVIERFVNDYCQFGFSNYCDEFLTRMNQQKQAQISNIMASEFERYYFQTKKILIENREFLDALAKELVDRKTLTAKDLAIIKKKISKK